MLNVVKIQRYTILTYFLGIKNLNKPDYQLLLNKDEPPNRLEFLNDFLSVKNINY